MRYFFIDTENIDQYNFIDKYNLNNNDKIIMFITANSKNIKIEDLKRLTSCKSTIEYEEVFIGCKNALDFQLIVDLSLIVKDSNLKEDMFYIVSNDNDFNYPINFLKNKTNAEIKVLKCKKPTSTTKPKTASIYSSLNLNDEVISIIKKSKALNILHNNLRDKYGEEGIKLYKKIKPYYESNSLSV